MAIVVIAVAAAIVVVLVFFVFLMRMALDQDRIPEWIRDAQTYPLLERGAEYVKDVAPQVGERVQQRLPLDESPVAQ